MNETTIKQKTIILQFDTTSVTVRRMYWKTAKDFLKQLAKHVAGLGITDPAAIVAKLPEVISSVDELATFLAINSTDLKPEEFDKLDLAQAAAVLQAAIELNLGDELKNSFAGIVAVLANLMPAMKTTPGAPSTPV